MTSFEEKLASVPEHLRELVLRQLAGEAEPDGADRPIARAPRSGPLPLSSAQQGLWFLSELDPGSVEYNATWVLRLRGELDVDALTAAVDHVVRRHESLRTTFDSVDGRGVQVVHEPADVPVPLVDLSGPEAERALEQYLLGEMTTPFDLRRGPLFRAAVLRLGPGHHALSLSMHHIVCDGWSIGRLFGELAEVYSARSRGVPPQLPPLPVQYADFAVWEQERLAAGALDGQLDHWRRRLDGVRALELPTDRPRPPVRSSAGAVHVFDLPAPLLSRLRDLARENSATLFMPLAAATGLLLSRYSGEQDIAVGTVTAGRGRQELENLVGLFINTVVLRSRVDESLPFTDLLSAFRSTLLDAFANEDVPFQLLVEALRPERDPSRPPLVQVMVNLQNLADAIPRIDGLEVSEVKPPMHVAKLDLVFDFYEDGDSLTCYLEYSTDLYDRATVERLGRHLLVLLEAAADDPHGPVHVLPLLTASERHDLVVGWQGRRAPLDPARPVLEVFDEQVRRTPLAVAVRCGARRLTFTELAERSNQLAHHLVGLGVGPGVLVGVCLDRDVDAVVALLGVLKAGGAFVPMDPEYPAQRLTAMLADADAPVVITQHGLRDRVAGHPATLVELDRDRAALDLLPTRPTGVAVSPDDLAYVVYTSGSTGKPKGVLVDHRNVHYVVHAWNDRYGLDRLRGRCLAVSSLGVDLFFGDFLLSALFGGEMLVCPADVMADPPALAALVVEQRPEIMVTTPSLLKAVSQELFWLGRGLDSLRVLAVGSEPWLVDDAVKLVDQLGPDTVVTNNYGATETTVDSTVFEVRGATGTSAVVPIGRPLVNTRVYLLDARMRPVPVGVFGEIHVGGDGVARGYLNRPELTGQRFVRDPFSDEPGARVYRTGDIGRWQADGVLEIVGRVDDQVKVRGFRVELGEVETAMARHPDIAAAAAAVRRDESGRDRLVGYVVAAGDRAPDLGELRAFLVDVLPDPAVPSALVNLAALPMTPNGTLDRRALPVPDRVERGADRHVAPRNPVETVLAGIWAELLDVDPDRVGITDNFFGLGGDSIVGLQVVSRARRAGLRVTAKQIFLHQTVADLAAVATVEREPAAVAVPATGDVRPTPVQRWYFTRFPDAPAHYNQSVFLELADGVDPRALRTAFTAVLDHHDAFRLRFERTPDGWRQHYSPAGHGVLLRSVDLSALDGDAQDAAVRDTALAAQSGLRLDSGPVAAAVLFTLGPDRGARLFVAVHHLVVDGVSWRVLLADLSRAHQDAAAGRSVRPEPKSSSFRHWSDRLHRAAAEGRFDAEREYWSGVERAIGQAPGLPVDAAGENTVGSAATVSVRLGADTTRALLRDVPDVYRTQVNDVLVSALAAVLAAWTGGGTVGVELEGHGREDLFPDVDLSRTVGWFTSIYPVAITPPAGADWGATVKAVKEQLRAVPTAGLGYGVLRYLTDAALVGTPRCQVGFNYHGRFDLDGADADAGPYRRWLDAPVPDEGPHLARQNLIEIIGMVREGELRFDWEYSTAVHHESTIARLAAGFAAALEQVVEHCARPGAGGRTPSDFPLAGLDQEGVDRIAGDGRRVEDIYPLTPMQSGLLFHSLGSHDTDIYFTHFGVELDGVTDPDALARAWQRVVDRTPVLRTAVSGEHAGEPRQVVHRDVRLPVAHHDWRAMPEPERRRARERLWEECRSQEIDLTEPPLLRVHIARLSATSVYLLCSSHHILLDGWSFAAVLSDVYEQHAALTGAPMAAPEPRRPYREYVRWLGEQDEAVAAGFWTRAMAGFTAPTPLPYDRPPLRAHQSRDTASLDLALSPEDTRRLLRFTRDARVTTNTLLQGAWALMLSRFSGERDVCFGTTVSGRPADLAGADDMIGLFINTVPARVVVDRGLDVVTWLRRVQEQQAEARQFEHVSLAQVRNWSEVPQGGSLFESVVVFENFPYDDEAAARHGLRLRGQTSVESSNYPLTCVADLTDVLRVRFGYDPHLFDERTARRMSEQFLLLLAEMVAGPERALRRLPAADDAELHRLLVRWNDSAADYPRECLHELFTAQARRTPEAPAVVRGEARLTYRELDSRANRLAGELVGHGVGPEVPVGIFLDGGPEMVTAVLGVLKAGGAYVPIDPSYPSERVAYLLDDTAVPLVLTDTGLVDRLPRTAARVLRLDEERARVDRRPDVAPRVDAHPDTLAGLVYTSGSTGTPKGSMITHRGLVRLVLPLGAHTFDGAEVVAQHHSISFDASQNELWNALLTGGCLAVRPGGFRSVDELDEFLKANRVAAMSFAAGFFHAVADTDPGILAGLRKVVVGGETLSPEHCARVLERLPHLEIVNAYGPTECSVTATCFPVAAVAPGDQAVPIGLPVANASVHLLDDDLALVPTGVAGEAYIAGDGLTRGYWARAALTAEKFVANPFGPPGSRMYRTGDVLRRRADGHLEFVGRTDDQVKVRGYRIELGEVEQAIARHADVGRAAVVVREDRPGRKQLVAYVVARAGVAVDPAGLRAAVSGTLPEYMVPAAFLVLDELPLTPHGKVDRRALPEVGQGATDRPHVPPGTPAEETMAGIWAEVLGVPRVGITDNFFDLGGDSILSIQVVFKSRRADLPISSNDLFRYPTIAELAGVAGRGGRQVAATQEAVSGDVPLTPIQRELFARCSGAPRHFNQSALIELVEGVDEDALRAAFAGVMAHHDALRMRYAHDGVRWSQHNAPVEEGEVLRRHDLSSLDDARAEAVMRELAVEADSTMDLARGPLVRALLFDRGPGRRPWLYLTAHHLVIDTVSWRVLSDDLDTAYRQAADGEPVRLSAKTSSFRQWARRLTAHVEAGGFDEELEHWTALPARTPVPVDHDGPNLVSTREVLRLSLTEAETAALLHVAPGVFRARVNDVLLGALAWALCRWAGGDRLLIELEGHGREEIFDDIDLSRTVGWFTSSYPVLLTVPDLDREDWPALVRSVRRDLRSVPGNGLGYGALRYLGPPGTAASALAGRTPPEVVFNYHSQIDEITRVEGRSLYHAFHDSIGQEQDPDERATQLLEIVGAARDGRLGFDWYYSTNRHDRATVERVAGQFREALGALARHSDPSIDQAIDQATDEPAQP